jgi:hypothetical protein
MVRVTALALHGTAQCERARCAPGALVPPLATATPTAQTRSRRRRRSHGHNQFVVIDGSHHHLHHHHHRRNNRRCCRAAYVRPPRENAPELLGRGCCEAGTQVCPPAAALVYCPLLQSARAREAVMTAVNTAWEPKGGQIDRKRATVLRATLCRERTWQLLAATAGFEPPPLLFPLCISS